MSDTQDAAAARAVIDRLRGLGVESELDPTRRLAAGRLKLGGEAIANLWNGTPVESIGFVSAGADEIRFTDPGYLSDAPPLSIARFASAADLASAAAKEHDAWVARLTDLDVDLARLKLGHRLHATRGLYVVTHACGNRTVEFGIRADGVVELFKVDQAPVDDLPPELRELPFTKPNEVAELESAISVHAELALAAIRAGAGRAEVKIVFRNRDHLRQTLADAISRGGLFFLWDGVLQVGSRVVIQVELPGAGRSVPSEGEVVVVLGAGEASKQGRQPGVGVKLTGSPEGLRSQIESFLASPDPVA